MVARGSGEFLHIVASRLGERVVREEEEKDEDVFEDSRSEWFKPPIEKEQHETVRHKPQSSAEGRISWLNSKLAKSESLMEMLRAQLQRQADQGWIQSEEDRRLISVLELNGQLTRISVREETSRIALEEDKERAKREAEAKEKIQAEARLKADAEIERMRMELLKATTMIKKMNMELLKAKREATESRKEATESRKEATESGERLALLGRELSSTRTRLSQLEDEARRRQVAEREALSHVPEWDASRLEKKKGEASREAIEQESSPSRGTAEAEAAAAESERPKVGAKMKSESEMESQKTAEAEAEEATEAEPRAEIERPKVGAQMEIEAEKDSEKAETEKRDSEEKQSENRTESPRTESKKMEKSESETEKKTEDEKKEVDWKERPPPQRDRQRRTQAPPLHPREGSDEEGAQRDWRVGNSFPVTMSSYPHLTYFKFSPTSPDSTFLSYSY